MKEIVLAFTAAILTLSGTPTLGGSNHDPGRSHYRAPLAGKAPVIDGIADESQWALAEWRPIDHIWLGGELGEDDFSGRYKVLWTRERIYLLVEFVDDVLVDFHRNPLIQYWDDDCLEIFIDEDHSGGDHQYNHNAFAYHLSLDNQAIDIGTDRQARSYSHHVKSLWRQQGEKVVWEVAIDIYSDDYRDDSSDNKPVLLNQGKRMGFMVAYCDNDHSELREHFIGSEDAGEEHRDRGWIDANMFGTLELVE